MRTHWYTYDVEVTLPTIFLWKLTERVRLRVLPWPWMWRRHRRDWPLKWQEVPTIPEPIFRSYQLGPFDLWIFREFADAPA